MKKNIANSELNNLVSTFEYDRSKLKPRIAHLGFGAFHRAHQGLITDRVARCSESDWGYCEINLIGGEQLISDLQSQDNLYTVCETGATNTDVKLIGAVCKSMHPALDGIDAVLEQLADPDIAIVSLTITEKGYCIEPGSGRLDKSNKFIAEDIANPSKPMSALGYIVEALRLRKERGVAPFSVMSCDNIPENGHLAKRAVLDLAEVISPELAKWIGDKVTFPCTMVDRIVPAATPESLQALSELLGVEDPCGITCEPFLQWVIEDNFVSGRPDWDLGGAEFVEDVVPYEEMKLRMLNGSHSFLAYLGYLGGYKHISDTMTNPDYKDAAFRMMMDNQAPTLNMPEGTDLKQYAELLIERFVNPSLKHQTWQIARDGSQKPPQRMLESIRYHLNNDTDFSFLALGVAGWMRYVGGVDDSGAQIDVRDPMAEVFKSVYERNSTNESVMNELLNLEGIFGSDLIENQTFTSEVLKALDKITSDGCRISVASL